jgi:hypothetical protein
MRSQRHEAAVDELGDIRRVKLDKNLPVAGEPLPVANDGEALRLTDWQAHALWRDPHRRYWARQTLAWVVPEAVHREAQAQSVR